MTGFFYAITWHFLANVLNLSDIKPFCYERSLLFKRESQHGLLI